MRYIFFFLLAGVLAGCKTPSPPTVIEQELHVPLPDGTAQTFVVKKSTVRAFSLSPPPSKYVVVRWSPNTEEDLFGYWVTLRMKGGWAPVTYYTPSTKIDISKLMLADQVEAGWYRIEVEAADGSMLRSTPVIPAYLFWKP